MIPQNKPTKKPPATSFKVCCRTMIRAEPSIPDKRMKMHNEVMGLKLKIKLYDSSPPTIMPLLAMWVLIFHLKLTSVQIIMQMRVAAMMPLMYRGR